jgi:predicted peroxiredoxin
VKYTSWHEPILLGTKVEDAIQNGVKETHRDAERHPKTVEDTIQNGVKETKKGGFNQHYDMFRTIENGVKETKKLEHDRTTYHAHFSQEHGTHTPLDMVQDVVQNGIKETKTPGADGDILSTLEWIKENNTVNIPELIDDVIENGVKHTEAGWAQYNSVDDVIERGIKRTKGGMLFDETKVDRIISEGVKETKCGGYLSSIEMKGKMVHQLESPKQNNELDDVIEHGVKLTNRSFEIDGSCVVEDVIQNGIKETSSTTLEPTKAIEYIIQNGIKETHDDVYHNKGRVDGVIKNGVKEVKPSYRVIINPMNFESEIIEDTRLLDITDVICDGVKEIQPLPAQDGNRDWGNYYYRKGEPTKPHTKYVDEVIENGIKETKPIDYSDNTEFIVDGVISRGISI